MRTGDEYELREQLAGHRKSNSQDFQHKRQRQLLTNLHTGTIYVWPKLDRIRAFPTDRKYTGAGARTTNRQSCTVCLD